MFASLQPAAREVCPIKIKHFSFPETKTDVRSGSYILDVLHGLEIGKLDSHEVNGMHEVDVFDHFSIEVIQ